MRLLLWLPLSCTSFDGQSNPASPAEVQQLYLNPGCAGQAEWEEIRANWESIQPLQIVTGWTDIDSKLSICFFGVVSLLYRAALKNASLFSLLDFVYSAVHPGLFVGWPVKDSDIGKLRLQVGEVSSPHILKVKSPHISPLPRIYVYPAPTLFTSGSSFCSKGQWGAEVHLHDFLWAHRTEEAELADFFFVPGYAICVFEGGFASLEEINEAYIDLLSSLAFWKGREKDHIFTFASGFGRHVFRDWKTHIPTAISLTPETGAFTNFPPHFVHGQDIAIPGHLHRVEIAQLLSLASDTRDILAVFFGRIDASRPTRVALLQHDPADVFVGSNLPPEQMYTLMGLARFCLIPKGKSAWSLRLYEALWAGCVPVILSDDWVLPFSHAVGEGEFALRFPQNFLGSHELVESLRSQTEQKISALRAGGRRARCLFSYVFEPSFLQERHIELPPGLCEHLPSAQRLLLTQLGTRRRV